MAEGWWPDVHSSDPNQSSNIIRKKFKTLLNFNKNNNIKLVVVNLPENAISRVMYDPNHYRGYIKQIQESIGGTPFLDLHDFLEQAEFFDVVHPTPQGAARVTDRVMQFVRANVEF